MTNFDKTNRNKVKRVPDRGHYDRETLYKILDAGYLCHLGFAIDGQPFVIPTSYGRNGDKIYVHGATTSRMLKALQTNLPVCLTVTHLDGLVLARSVFHHSMNYRSAMVFGTATLVAESEKLDALKLITEHIIKGRWEESRKPNAKELKATSVLALNIEEASSKIRTGPPSDEKEDYSLPIWAGVLPISQVYQPAIPDPQGDPELPFPSSVNQQY